MNFAKEVELQLESYTSVDLGDAGGDEEAQVWEEVSRGSHLIIPQFLPLIIFAYTNKLWTIVKAQFVSFFLTK